MADDGFAIGIEFGGIKELLKTTEDVIGFVDKISDQTKKIRQSGSLADALAGDEAAYRDIQKQIQAVTEKSNQFKEQIDQIADTNLRDKVVSQLTEVTTQLDEQNKKLIEQRRLQKANAQAGLGASRSGFSNDPQFAQGSSTQLSEAVGQISAVVGSVAALSAQFEPLDFALGGLIETFGVFPETMEEGEKSASAFIAGIAEVAAESQMRIEQLSSFTEGISNFGEGIQLQGDRMQRAAKSQKAMNGRLGTMGRLTGGAAKGLQGLGAVVGKLGPIGMAAGVAIEAFRVGIELFDKFTGKSAEQIQRRIERMNEQVELQYELNELIQEGNVEAIEDNIEATRREIDMRREQIRSIEETFDQNTSGWDSFRTDFNSFFGDDHEFGDAADAIRELEREIEGFERELNTFSVHSAKEAARAMRELNEEMERAQETIDEVKDFEEELLESRMEQFNSLSQLQDDLMQLEKDYAADSVSIFQDRNEEDQQMLEDHLAELESMQAAYDSNIEDMRDEHLSELTNAEKEYRDEINDLITTYTEDLNDMQIALQEDLADMEEQFRIENIEATEDYNKTVAKMEEDFQKDRIKRQKDLAEQLFEAEMSNDALQFFMLKRKGEKEEKEAQEQHAEALTEEQKAYEEAKAERAQQYAEEKAERKQQYAEEKMEREQQHQEELAEAAAAHKERMAQMKAEFAERLQEEYELLQKEKAARVEAYEESVKALEEQRLLEDQQRQEDLERKRAALQESFQLELDYFAERERILMGYIENIRGLEAHYSENIRSFEDGIIGGRDNLAGAMQDISRALALVSEDVSLAPEERRRQQELLVNQYEALRLLQENNTTGLTDMQTELQRIYVGFTEDGNIGIDQEASLIIADRLSQDFNTQVNAMRDQANLDLTYGTGQDRAAFEFASGVSESGGSGAASLQASQEQMYQDMNLLETEYGTARADEREEYLRRQQRLEDEYAGESLDSLRNRTDTENRVITQTNDEIQRNNERSQDERIAAQQRFHYGVENETTQAYMEQTGLTEEGYQRILEQAGIGLEEQVVQEEEHADEMATTRDGVQERRIQQETEHADEQLALAEEQNAAEIEHEKVMFEGEMERELERQLMMQELITSTYQQTAQQVTSVNRMLQVRVVNYHRQMAQGILSTTAQMLSQMRSYLAQAKAASGRGRGRGRDKSDRASKSSSRGYTLAARGAFVDRPTELIAGEGKTSEVIFPFDESKGIPKDILAQMGRDIGRLVLDKSGSLGPSLPENTQQQTMNRLISAVNEMKNPVTLQVDGVNVGSNISRSEVVDQFRALQGMLTNVFNESVNKI